MYDKPGQFCRPSHKNHMADHILFEKEIDFCMTFVWPLASWPASQHMGSCI